MARTAENTERMGMRAPQAVAALALVAKGAACC